MQSQLTTIDERPEGAPDLGEADPGPKKAAATRGAADGLQYAREVEDDFDADSLLFAVKYVLANSRAPMSNAAIVRRLQSELDAHYLHQKLLKTDKRLGQLANLHQYHDTFLKESHEALKLELGTIEERLVAAQDKPVVDAHGREVDPAARLRVLEADMRQIFKLIEDYSEIFDNYKEAVTALRNIFEASQATAPVRRARKKRQAAVCADPDEAANPEPRVFKEGKTALSDLRAQLVERNPEIDV